MLTKHIARIAGFAAACLFASAVAAAPAKRHMIVTANPYASEAGLEILRAGGSAVDAAIAAQMVLTLVEPQSSGIGGGAFLMVADADGGMHAYDGREVAPASATSRMFLDASGKPRGFMDAVVGGLSVGVPGDVAVLAKAHAAHGRLPWARLFEPAIKLAETGFKVPPRLAVSVRLPHLEDMPAMRALYFHADGTPVAEGETLHNPDLAKALRAIAAGGADAFYKGPIAAAIADAVTHAPRNPTPFTAADLAGYRAKDRTPVCGPYRAYRVCSVPPPAGGVVVLQILGMLNHMHPLRSHQPPTAFQVHLFLEAGRLAYADRARWLGDPDFVDVPTLGLIDPGYIARRAKLIPASRDMGTAEAGTPPMRHTLDYAPAPSIEHGTSHLSVIDKNGEAVSMTTTVESTFGSHLATHGFVLNNQLTDFAFVPAVDGTPVANAPAAGKRPQSSMSPTIVFGPEGKFFAAIGSPDGRNIISYVAQTIVAVIDGHLSMQAAIDLPHYVNQNGDSRLEENTSIAALAPALTAMGHTVAFTELRSGLAGIRRVKGGYEGGADPRRDGVAMGD